METMVHDCFLTKDNIELITRYGFIEHNSPFNSVVVDIDPSNLSDEIQQSITSFLELKKRILAHSEEASFDSFKVTQDGLKNKSNIAVLRVTFC